MIKLYVQKSYYDRAIDVLYSEKPFADLSNCKYVKREYDVVHNAKIMENKQYRSGDAVFSFNFLKLEDGTILSPEKYIHYNMANTNHVLYTTTEK